MSTSTHSVPGTTSCWRYQDSNGGAINSGLVLTGLYEGTDPIRIPCSPGSDVTISASGLIRGGGGNIVGECGPAGFDDAPPGALWNTSGTWPAYYTSEGLVGYFGLIGAFCDDAGIVKKVIGIGVGGTFECPAGATHIHLGINDGGCSDNSGSFAVTVTTVDRRLGWQIYPNGRNR